MSIYSLYIFNLLALLIAIAFDRRRFEETSSSSISISLIVLGFRKDYTFYWSTYCGRLALLCD